LIHTTHKLGVIRTLFRRADTISSNETLKQAEHQHLKSALGTCGYRDWTFHKAHARSQPPKDSTQQDKQDSDKVKRRNVTIPYVSGLSEKLRRIFGQHQIPVSFKPSNTLRQKLVHPKDKTSKDKLSNIVYAIQCQDTDCQELYIGETKQTLAKRMSQHRRASSGCGDSAVYLHLDSTKHSFDNKDVSVLDKEHRWYERGVKEAIYVKKEQPSLNKGGGLRHNLAGAYSSVISKIPKKFNSRSSTTCDITTSSRVSDQLPPGHQSA